MISEAEWRAYTKSGNKPNDIPAYPEQTYAKDGWAGMRDWLGTSISALRLRKYRLFKEARAFVHSLKLKSGGEWLEYCASGKKPTDIPNSPEHIYKEAGWAGTGDWLGTGRVAPGHYRSCKKARDYVRRLGLKSWAEWRDYCRSGKKPDDIPASPYKTYAKADWAGMGDWLGYERKDSHREARS